MKTKIFALTLTFLIFFGVKRSSAQNENSTKPQFGVGVTLFNLSDNNNFNTIYFSLNLKNSLRIEPSFGLAKSDNFEDYHLGLGVFGTKAMANNFQILYGARLGATKHTATIAPALSGEYFLIDNFSIASEVQLRFLSANSNWLATTYSAIMVRFYF